MALFYSRQFGKLAIDAHLAGTVGHIKSYDTTHELQEFSETISTASIKIDCTYPLGISSIYETGLSLQADITRHGLPIKKVGLGAMILWGEDAIGWALRTSYRF